MTGTSGMGTGTVRQDTVVHVFVAVKNNRTRKEDDDGQG
jgi:hypothetical protein